MWPIWAAPTIPVTGVDAGDDHTCAVRADGSVVCWGLDHLGQTGTADAPGPVVVVEGLADVVEVASGGDRSCARHADGTVSCWGAGTVNPALVDGIDHAVALAVGTAFACARLADRTVSCWGDNDLGQLGDGTRVPRDHAEPVPGLAGVVDLAAGAGFACAVDRDGAVLCWGDGALGQTGLDRDATGPGIARFERPRGWATGEDGCRRTWQSFVATLVPVPIRTPPAVALRAGDDAVCAIGLHGARDCWGRARREPRTRGDLAIGPVLGVVLAPDGTVYGGWRFRTAMALPGPATAVTVGRLHACALLADGALECWGRNGSDQLGFGAVARTALRGIPVATGGQAVSHGDWRVCALANAEVRCWSRDLWTERLEPEPPLDLPAAVGISSGPSHECAALSTGAVACWDYHQEVALVPGLRDAVAVATSATDTCALRATGEVACWGEGEVPVRIPDLTDAVEIGVGEDVGCARRTSGSVACWSGAGPIEIPGVADAEELTVGVNVACVRRAGDVWCWTAEAPPRRIALGDAVAVAAEGSNRVCALRAGGTVGCWGPDDEHPLEVVDLVDPVAIATGAHEVCVLSADGTLRCWPILLDESPSPLPVTLP